MESQTRLVAKSALIVVTVLAIITEKGMCKTDSPSRCSSPALHHQNFVCPAPSGVYPHAEYCECYYSCFNNSATLYKCIQQNLFDISKNGCNFPENTDCGNRTVPEGYPPPRTTTTPTPVPFECPVEVADDWFADPTDCAAFYRCVHGFSYHFTCAPPNLFHDVNKECDHPGNVDCGSRPTSSIHVVH